MGQFDPVVFDEHSARVIQREINKIRQIGAELDAQLRRYQATYTPAAKIRFKNNSSEAAPAFAVMRITGVTKYDCLTIDKPNSTFKRLYLVNGRQAVPAAGYGFGSYLMSQLSDPRDNYVLYDTGTPAIGEYWGAKDAQWTLSVNRPGFYVLGGNDTTLKTTLAVQEIPQEILVKNATGGDIAAGSSGSFTIYGGASGSEATLSMSITALNKTSVAFKDTKFGSVGWLNGVPYAVPWQS